MANTLLTIHDLVSDSLARGTTLDAEIPNYVKQAALWFERNHNFAYMEKFGELTLDPDASQPRVIDLPSQRVKEIKFIRYLDEDSIWNYIPRVDGENITKNEEGPPTAYWLSGKNYIILDNTIQEETELELQWYEYTEWPTDTSATNWLIEFAPDFLVAQTLLLMAPRLRDKRLREEYTAQRNEALRTLLLEQDTYEQADRSVIMKYDSRSSY
jgi:hypothetical protein